MEWQPEPSGSTSLWALFTRSWFAIIFWPVVIVGALVSGVVAYESRLTNAFERGQDYEADVRTEYFDCVREEEAAYEKHYRRPADTMPEAEALALSRFCRREAERRIDRELYLPRR